jgi:mRNA interferase RelE/StbE
LYYSVVIRAKADKELSKLPRDMQLRIRSAVIGRSDNPRPGQSKKLVGAIGWRLRVGDDRVVYKIVDAALVIEVVRIAHRREVYR